jgi:hypothetical protein
MRKLKNTPQHLAIPRSGLESKWILLNDDNYERWGQIIQSVGADDLLVRMDWSTDAPPFAQLCLLNDITDALIFDSREALEKFLTWREEPDNSRKHLKVVRLPPNDKEPA